MDNYNRLSSLSGGTILYIKGSGFSSMTSDNSVMIGNNVCVVLGANAVYIQCSTTQNGKAESLLLSVSVNGVMAKCASYDCLVSYSSTYTPQLSFILPGAMSVNNLVTFQGQLQIGLTSDIQFIKINQFQCNLLDQIIKTFDFWSANSRVSCLLSKDLSAGVYLSQFSTPSGDLDPLYSSFSYDLLSTPY